MQRKLISLAALAVVVAAIAGVGYAAIPSSNGVISACKDSKGALKVIDAEAGQTCGPNQQPLSWNQQGPAGPQGTSGISGYARVFSDNGPSDSDYKYAFASCPAGKTAIGGGASIKTPDGTQSDAATLMRVEPFPTGYSVGAVERESTTWTLRAVAICATVAP